MKVVTCPECGMSASRYFVREGVAGYECVCGIIFYIFKETELKDMHYVKVLEKHKNKFFEVAYLRPEYTCDDCQQVDKCEFAFDLYNTDGDCLAEK